MSCWGRPMERSMEASGPFSVPRATVVWGVDASMPGTFTVPPLPGLAGASRRRLGPGLHHRFQALPPRDPGGAVSGQEHQAAVVLHPRPQLDLEISLGQEPLDGIAPLDEGHPVGIHVLLEPEVDDLLDSIEAIHVQMVDGDLPA